MHCSSFHLCDAFTPLEITAAQILMFVSLASGILGFAALLYALRNAFFGIKKRTRFAFRSGGVLTLLAAILSLIPLLWNAVVVLHGGSINFPPDFKLPPTPEEQQVGVGPCG
uniref:Uncharacterized protein n=1 Tax=Knipowitschia caucasica TaxID=637954 RepID=A0AAV2LC36_KNICA